MLKAATPRCFGEAANAQWKTQKAEAQKNDARKGFDLHEEQQVQLPQRQEQPRSAQPGCDGYGAWQVQQH